MDEIELTQQVETLRQELAELRTVVAQLRSGGGGSPSSPPPVGIEETSPASSRRQLLRKGGLAVGAGLAAAAGVGRGAAAAPGDAVVQDGHTVGSGSTTVETTGNMLATALSGIAGAENSFSTVGVRGHNKSNTFGTGVLGSTTSGIGVHGHTESNFGVGVAGVSGHRLAVHVGDTAGVAGVGGHPNGVGVRGEWRGFAPEHGTGVLGTCTSPGSLAVHGRAEAGTGVSGTSLDGLGGAFTGTTANVRLEPVGPAPTTLTDAHERGELYFDLDGDLWVCIDAGSPGIWRNLTRTEPRLVATTPFRVYDSRFADGFLAAGASRRVAVRDAIDLLTGKVYWTDATPPGALAVTFNITATETVHGGFLATTPGDATVFHTSSVNWATSGDIVANATLVKLDGARRMRVFAGGPAGAGAQFVVDVTGYIV